MTSIVKGVQPFIVEKEIAFVEAIAKLHMGHNCLYAERMQTFMNSLQEIKKCSDRLRATISCVTATVADSRLIDKERVTLVEQYLKEKAEFWEME